MCKLFSLRSLFFLTMCCIFISGCRKSDSSEKSVVVPPVFSSLTVLVPSADGEKILGAEPLLLDVSHIDHGYMIAEAVSSDLKYNIQLTDPNAVTYSYFIHPEESAVIPFTGGDGTYCITAYEQIDANQYAALYCEKIELELANEFYPFLYPNQYVNFTPESDAAQLALTLLPEESEDLDVLAAIYDYVLEHLTYDTEKAQTVQAGYLPDIDLTLSSGTGICFDYAALMAAMLRCRDIPCKLQIGYSNEIKHAWVDVFIDSIGWVNKAISFDGETWTRMDPTFDSTGEDTSIMQDYIGDGNNYTVQFTR